MFDSADPKSNSPAEPVELYPIGRFVLPVPKALKYSGASFTVDDIKIKEHDWTDKDHGKQWLAAWQPLRDKKKKAYDSRLASGRPLYSGFAEKEVSRGFSAPGMTICYGSGNGGGMHYVDTYLQRPDIFLQLKGEVFLEDDDCAKVNVQELQLPLYQAYKYGKENPAPNSFFTEKGRVENFAAKDERAGVAFFLDLSEQQEIVFSFNSRTPTTPGLNSLDSMSKVHGLAAKWKVDIDTLRSRPRDFAGRAGLEEVLIMTETKDDGEVRSQLYAKWQIQGELGNPQKPYVELGLTADITDENGDKNIWKKHPEYREQVLRMWQAITDGLMSAEEYYSR